MQIELEKWDIQRLVSALESRVTYYNAQLDSLGRDDCYTMNARDRKEVYECEELIKKLRNGNV